jgi:hypothetical protein
LSDKRHAWYISKTGMVDLTLPLPHTQIVLWVQALSPEECLNKLYDMKETIATHYVRAKREVEQRGKLEQCPMCFKEVDS